MERSFVEVLDRVVGHTWNLYRFVMLNSFDLSPSSLKEYECSLGLRLKQVMFSASGNCDVIVEIESGSFEPDLSGNPVLLSATDPRDVIMQVFFFADVNFLLSRGRKIFCDCTFDWLTSTFDCTLSALSLPSFILEKSALLFLKVDQTPVSDWKPLELCFKFPSCVQGLQKLTLTVPSCEVGTIMTSEGVHLTSPRPRHGSYFNREDCISNKI
eukprot:TRINITY_DN3829_c0_g1_i1.p1 TRINITY_DN3829_c0_g1~~TRINITY_DN3829_c0_g1_i1.p1  ORF type:complete len:213 (-),score=22.83 TRINITY_DN3829_c0_g1_i1:327-965(-)